MSDDFLRKVIASGWPARSEHRAGHSCTADDVLAKVIAGDDRSRQATRAGAQAFTRLLNLAEEGDSGQVPRIARFLAATYNGRNYPLDVYELRAVDVEISDDMLACLDA